MTDQKHLIFLDRCTIESLLNNRFSFKAIGRELDKDCTTISKEIRNHRIFKKTGSFSFPFNNCIHRHKCDVRLLCKPCTNRTSRLCNFCRSCIYNCNQFEAEICSKLSLPPYVCTGCKNIKNCRLEKAFYNAKDAQKEYEEVRSDSRSGITINEAEATYLDKIISPLILNGQSIHHICTSNRDIIMCSEKTIYNYIDYNIFSARNIDLPRKVKYRPRKSNRLNFKVDKSCRVGRTYNNYLSYISEYPDTPVIQMDSVEGVKGGKVLLTLHFVESEMMLAFLRDANNSQSVIDIFEGFYFELSPSKFMELFQLLLGDNGSEFSNPAAIEFDRQGMRRTRLYYCDPSAPYQKGAAENNHEFIRRICPKGTSFDSLTQSDINLMMDHINSYGRKKLGDKCPYDAFEFIYGKELLKKLGCKLIPPKEIILQPSLLKK